MRVDHFRELILLMFVLIMELQSNPLNITSLYVTLRFMSRNLYPRPAPIEYNQATLRLVSLRTMSQIG